MIFTLFDILIITILSISTLLGLYRGMINITINLIGFVASIFAAILLYPYILIVFSGYVDNELITSIASGAFSYLLSLVFFTFLTSKIVLLFSSVSKGVFDRLLGLVLGSIRGVLLALIIFGAVGIFTAGTYSDTKNSKDLISKLSIDNYPDWLKNSTTTPYLEKTLKSSVFFIPDGIWDLIKIPHKDSDEEEDIIETIKKRKAKDVNSSIEHPINKDLEKGIEEIYSGDE
ncbi:MAG: CvpA family protein [Rickettsiaceae bacterium]|nr:CvpA family protein [Rickettsiaceae bacterium]MDP4832619.1 CvpA family protein [Rickettsiaceae bacterium]MDP5021241.1 CvpA family protein [Rickettsiaceae bacterium]MDP5083184.1 CvpA family protein [Rickettsiaceae bacterium]